MKKNIVDVISKSNKSSNKRTIIIVVVCVISVLFIFGLVGISSYNKVTSNTNETDNDSLLVAKEFSFDYEFENNLSDNLCVENVIFNNEKITIKASSKIIDKIDKVKVIIDLSSYNTAGTFDSNDNFNIIVYDTNGNAITDYTLSDNTELSYSIVIDEKITKTFNNINIKEINLNDNLAVMVSSSDDTKVDVTLTGSKNYIESLTEEDISIYVDLKEYTTSGTFEVPLKYNDNLLLDYTLSKDKNNVILKER